jgi:outer membrane lipoprotein SlyB
MSRLLAISALGIASLVPAAVPAQAAYYHHHHYHSRHHHRVMQTVKRVGIGAAGGAAIGAIAGGGPGAAIGAIAGGGAGAIYDRHEKNHGH